MILLQKLNNIPGTIKRPGRKNARALCAALVSVLIAAAVLLTVCLPVCADETDVRAVTRVVSNTRVPYCFVIETVNGQGTGMNARNQIYITQNITVKNHGGLTLTGWLTCDEGIVGYEYAIVPSGGGNAEWRTVKTLVISDRTEYLRNIGAPYPTGYRSAGFELTVFPTDDGPIEDGVYDLYLRGVTGDGAACDVLAALSLVYGNADIETDTSLTVNIARLTASETYMYAGAEARNGNVYFPEDGQGVLKIGKISLAGMDYVDISYVVPDGFAGGDDIRKACLCLKSTNGRVPAGLTVGDGRYNLTDTAVYSGIDVTPGEHTVTVDVTQNDENGTLWLTCYIPAGNTQGITVSGIKFTYHNSAYTRTAAKIYLSADIWPYLSQYNHVKVETVTDPIMGEVMRIESVEDNNDPFVYFNASALLDENGVRINASEYAYMVVLARARKENRSGNQTFYLCAGAIGGPTEACTVRTALTVDGKWHYYILDMSNLETWEGLVHGWRFDMINANSYTGEYVDYASVQFFRTLEAAQRAASLKVDSHDDAYHTGNPMVFADNSEEESIQKMPVEEFTVRPQDALIEQIEENVTETDDETPEAPTDADGSTETAGDEPLTEALTVSETGPASQADDSDSGTNEPVSGTENAADPTDTAGSGESGGCGSVLYPGVCFILLIGTSIFSRKNKNKPKEENDYEKA